MFLLNVIIKLNLCQDQVGSTILISSEDQYTWYSFIQMAEQYMMKESSSNFFFLEIVIFLFLIGIKPKPQIMKSKLNQ